MSAKYPKRTVSAKQLAQSESLHDTKVLTIGDLVHQDDWVSDAERYRCHVCTRNFTPIRRKHHCRRCGEVICRNCALYKEAELPVIGRSKVRVCISCILAHANGHENPQSPSAKQLPSSTSAPPPPAVVPRPIEPPAQDSVNASSRWGNLQSPTTASEPESALSEANATSEPDYPLDFEWEHPWPKPPVLPNEEQRLQAVKSFDVLDTPAEDVFDIICDLASNALKCPIAAVSLMDEDRQWFKASVGLAQNEIPRHVSFCAHTITSKEPLVVMDATADRRFQKNPLVTGGASIRFYAGAPICTSNGEILGTVFVFDTKPRDSCDVATLEKLSNVAMKNLEDRKNAVATPVVKSEPRPNHVAQAPAIQAPASSPAPGAAATQQQLVAQPAGGADGAIIGGQKMENMLMDLLCRTTETQQQLATQQGSMFQTLVQHTGQIDKLADAVARMEAKLEEAAKK